MQVNHHQIDFRNQGSVVHLQHLPEGTAPFSFSNMQDMNQQSLLLDNIKTDGLEMYEAYNERLSAVREVIERSEEKQPVVYRRMKWTDGMVKLLITAISYIGEDFSSNGIPNRGKWRAISNVMDERGYHVAPQQCEDKFNDLNKKFKRLNDFLGRGTACHVVENPAFLEMMNLTDDVKEEVKKLLSSKQLFYKEMCSYFNKNRLFLPDDWQVQQSVLLALKGKEKNEPEQIMQDMPTKRRIAGEERFFNMACASHTITSDSNVLRLNCNRIHTNTNNEVAERSQNEQIIPRLLQLEERKLRIQAQLMELKKQRFKCLRFCRKEDRELQKMKLENEAMKLENEKLELELKRRGSSASE